MEIFSGFFLKIQNVLFTTDVSTYFFVAIVLIYFFQKQFGLVSLLFPSQKKEKIAEFETNTDGRDRKVFVYVTSGGDFLLDVTDYNYSRHDSNENSLGSYCTKITKHEAAEFVRIVSPHV